MNEYILKGILIGLACMGGIFVLGLILKSAGIKMNMVKPCPYCQELISPKARVCKHCHKEL